MSLSRWFALVSVLGVLVAVALWLWKRQDQAKKLLGYLLRPDLTEKVSSGAKTAAASLVDLTGQIARLRQVLR